MDYVGTPDEREWDQLWQEFIKNPYENEKPPKHPIEGHMYNSDMKKFFKLRGLIKEEQE